MAAWKRLLFVFFAYLTFSFSADAQQELVSPTIWYRVNPDSISSIIWKDYSGNGFNAKLPAGATDSVYYLNFNPVRKFNDQKAYGEVPYNADNLSDLLILAVYKASDTTEMGISGTRNGINRHIRFTTKEVLGPDSVVDNFSTGSRYLTLNTVAQSWEEVKSKTDGPTLTFPGIYQGQKTNAFTGYVGEFLFFNTGLPFLDRVKWETYLAIKYGITLTGKNYVSSAEMVLWDNEENHDYAHRITGLGRDAKFGLNQKESHNAQDTARLSTWALGAIAPTNRENSTQLLDQNFVLFGDNGENTKMEKGKGQDSVLTIMNRRWLAKASGNQIRGVGNTLALNMKGLDADSLGYWLVINRSGTDNFSIDNFEYITPDSISADSLAYYHNIYWDKDYSGSDNYTFAKIKPLFAVVHVLQQPSCTQADGGKVEVKIIKGEGDFSANWKMASEDDMHHETFASKMELSGLGVGNYVLELTDHNGNEFKRAFNLTLSNPIPVSLGPDQYISEGEHIKLDASKEVPDSLDVEYYWEGSFSFTSTNKTIEVTEPGVYRAFITNKANGCVFSDSVNISGNSIQKIEVFPNPVTNNKPFQISVSLKEQDDIHLKLTDLKGNVYLTRSGKGQSQYLFDVRINKAGFYMVVVETPDGIKTKKVIVH